MLLQHLTEFGQASLGLRKGMMPHSPVCSFYLYSVNLTLSQWTGINAVCFTRLQFWLQGNDCGLVCKPIPAVVHTSWVDVIQS